jgi:hypothetical protein
VFKVYKGQHRNQICRQASTLDRKNLIKRATPEEDLLFAGGL